MADEQDVEVVDVGRWEPGFQLEVGAGGGGAGADQAEAAADAEDVGVDWQG